MMLPQETGMQTLERVTVTIPQEMTGVMRAAIAAGDYASTSEIVREAIRDWKRKRSIDADSGWPISELRAALQAGLDSGTAVEGEAVFATILESLRARAAQQRAA
jgi:antitoxin ParD1/3/4